MIKKCNEINDRTPYLLNLGNFSMLRLEEVTSDSPQCSLNLYRKISIYQYFHTIMMSRKK